MRFGRTSARTGAITLLSGALVAGALLVAPAGEAAPPAATRASAIATGTAGTNLQGGDALYADSIRCTLGFNVRDSSNVYYFLTSRSCGRYVGYVWYDSTHTQVLGTTVAISPANKDYALVKYASGTTPPGTVDLYNGTSQDITSAADAYVGETVKRSGGTTHVHSGTVLAVNATVSTAEGTLTGLIKTNVCAEGGDTGGPLFDGTKAIGLYSRGSGTCSTGGTTYYQPVTEPLAVYGVTVY
jgi:hypothetical protein